MQKTLHNLSLNISITLSIIFFAACIVGAAVMPPVVEMLINTPDNIGNRGEITDTGRVFVLILAYIMLTILATADAFLFTLLLRVRKGLVFTKESVFLIRVVSWCCYLICIVFALLGIYFQLSFILAFFAAFLGICQSVVKNVIEEATRIKFENDLTV